MEAGFDYVCDWVLDDQPVVLKTRSGDIVNIPYTQECNDVAMMLIQHHAASEYASRAIDQFEQLHHDARTSARVMAIVVHPYIMGAPHRLKYFRRAIEHIQRRRLGRVLDRRADPRLVHRRALAAGAVSQARLYCVLPPAFDTRASEDAADLPIGTLCGAC